MIPLTLILIIKIFDCWGLDFMGSFPPSCGYLYILLAVDYVSEWVEAIPTRTNDHKVVLKFFHKGESNPFVTFPRFSQWKPVFYFCPSL